MTDQTEGTDVVVVLVTGPDASTLKELGRRVVEERIAACANVVDGVESVYRWEGRVEQAAEALAILKTTRQKAGELESRVAALHPYEEPEFLVLPVDAGADGYLAWVVASVSPAAG